MLWSKLTKEETGGNVYDVMEQSSTVWGITPVNEPHHHEEDVCLLVLSPSDGLC